MKATLISFDKLVTLRNYNNQQNMFCQLTNSYIKLVCYSSSARCFYSIVQISKKATENPARFSLGS
jgi:hypothetical protein